MLADRAKAAITYIGAVVLGPSSPARGPLWGPGAGAPTAYPAPTADAVPPATPLWAPVAFVIGLLCSLGVAWMSVLYYTDLSNGESPSVAMVYTIRDAPLLAVGVPLLIAGALGLARRWTHRRSWLRLPIIVGIVVWLGIVLGSPSWFVD
jgi:hypothetical protein